MNISFKSISIIFIIIISLIISSQTYTKSKETLIIQSTTSTRDSGFYDYILPIFKKKFNIEVYVVAVGTGLAIKNAMNCNADILITHATELEKKFIDEGYGIIRNDLMYNDFVIIGPKTDPAKIISSESAIDAFQKIFNNKSSFISRADDSGTNISERKVWSLALIKENDFNLDWYLESGQGMGQTLNIAVAKNAYTYTDRATWIRFKNKQNHRILYQNDPLLFNQYGIVNINPEKCPNINQKGATKLHQWLISDQGQRFISEFRLNNTQLFIPNYNK
ncbi:MAG: sulfate transporter [Gammaproteobacteria bacterium]|mgnify:CR=1 FL=1|nr:sulfate transporter [Gammaproteobacteria bacterium]|tara:strand:+ start:1192 stop:2025 length:834 start_codon:yes stop_codon:yes gene_type:complete